MAVSKRLRYEVLRRDNYACRYCGRGAPDVELDVDHVVPKALGGGDRPENLVAACEACNSGKSATPADAAVVADVQADVLRWGRAMKTAAEVLRAEARREAGWVQGFDEVWCDWKMPSGKPVPRPLDWPDTVVALKNAGLHPDQSIDAVDKAMRRRNLPPDSVWRYFCGIAWRTIDRQQQIAISIASAEDAEAR